MGVTVLFCLLLSMFETFHNKSQKILRPSTFFEILIKVVLGSTYKIFFYQNIERHLPL